MSKQQIKPGLGVRPKHGQLKIKKRMLGGRRVWVIINSGVATGLRYSHGQKTSSEVGPGRYQGEYTKHPINPQIDAVKVFEHPEDADEQATYLIPNTLHNQNVDFEIVEDQELIVSVTP